MASEFKLPDLGEGIAEGQIVRVMISEGDQVSEDQPIIEVETDKAAVEIPSPTAGKAQKIHVAEGDTVKVGQVLVTFEGGDGGAEKSVKKEDKKEEKAEKKDDGKKEEKSSGEGAKAQKAPSPAPPAAHRESPSEGGLEPKRTRAIAAPATRKLARNLGVDIDELDGSGPGGRVTREDVEGAASGGGQAAAAPAPQQAPAGQPASEPYAPPASLPVGAPPQIEGVAGEDNWGPIKTQKLSQIRKTIARQMSKSVSTIPHVTQVDDADVTELEMIRQSLKGPDGNGPRVTMMSFLMKALAHCLRLHPWFNSSFDSESERMVFKEYINIGIAVDSPRGLVVPVIRNADRLSVLGLAQELRAVAKKVRNVQYGVEDLRGGTFTVTNYGAIGGIYGTPIINHPEVAILGVGRTQERLVRGEDDEIEARQFMPLSLSFDHRAVDGAQAARFLNDVIAHLSNPGLLLIK